LPDRRFGISTHLFHRTRLSRDHLAQIASHGFDIVEIFAAQDHFDYRDDEAASELASWLEETGLELHSVHAPIAQRFSGGQWIGSFSNAARDEARRAAAVVETKAVLDLARRIPYHYLVLHVGAPEGVPDATPNDVSSARRSIQELTAMAAEVGVRLALEVIPNSLSRPEALVKLIEDDFEAEDLGVCFDYGHAHLMGDLGDAIEAVSGHLWTTHIHDNGGRADEHLVPFAGTIDWNSAIMATQKIGYEGALMLELAGDGQPMETLARAAAARKRLDGLFVTF
jgi:sugar phosphate isomerase/epimerase